MQFITIIATVKSSFYTKKILNTNQLSTK